MKPANIFELLPKDLNEEVVDQLVQSRNIRIERIISKGHRSPETGWYDQEEDEWVLLLQGAAVISYESGQQLHLKSGDYLEIPAHVKHKVSWTDPDSETIWLAIHYR